MNGEPLKPFRFRAIGLLVPLGHRTGVAEIYGVRFSGLSAWLVWRLIYLSLLPGLEKRVRVGLDWFIDLFFPRDTVITADSKAPALAELVQPAQDTSVAQIQEGSSSSQNKEPAL